MPDRAAIVTGASRGIGLAIAEALAEEGFGLTITARKPETLAQTAQALRDKGFEVEQLAANMDDEGQSRASSSFIASASVGSTCSSTTRAWGSARRPPSTRPSTSTCSST